MLRYFEIRHDHTHKHQAMRTESLEELAAKGAGADHKGAEVGKRVDHLRPEADELAKRAERRRGEVSLLHWFRLRRRRPVRKRLKAVEVKELVDRQVLLSLLWKFRGVGSAKQEEGVNEANGKALVATGVR